MRITCNRGILALWDRQGRMRYGVKFSWPFVVHLNINRVPSLFLAVPSRWHGDMWFELNAIFSVGEAKWGMAVSIHGLRPVLKFAWVWRGVNRVVSIGPVAGSWVRTYALPLA